jgi:hypothetical protein
MVPFKTISCASAIGVLLFGNPESGAEWAFSDQVPHFITLTTLWAIQNRVMIARGNILDSRSL